MLDRTDRIHRQLAHLWQQQLRHQAAHFGNMDRGRQNSAAYLDHLFHQLVAHSRPELFVEAGAFRAEASRRVKLDHPKCRVVAFEANPHNYQKLSSEIGFAGLGVDYRHQAVADRPGEVTFHVRTRIDGAEVSPIAGNNSMLTRDHDDTEYEKVTVAAVSLDSMIEAEPATAAAIWIDVEGASGPLLRGADRFLEVCDVIMIEVEERPWWQDQWLATDVISHLVERGFQPVSRDIEYENQYNLVLVSDRLAETPEVALALELHQSFLVHHMGGS